MLPKVSRGSKADIASGTSIGKDHEVRDSRKRRAVATSPPQSPPKKSLRGVTAATRESRQASRNEVKAPALSPQSFCAKRQAKKPSPSGHEALNRRVKVYWPGRKLWQDGVVTEYNKQEDTHFVKYDTGEEQWVTLRAKEDNRRLKWVDSVESLAHLPMVSSPTAEAADGDSDAEQRHRRSRSGSGVQSSGGGCGGAQSRSSSRVAKPSIKRQAQMGEQNSPLPSTAPASVTPIGDGNNEMVIEEKLSIGQLEHGNGHHEVLLSSPPLCLISVASLPFLQRYVLIASICLSAYAKAFMPATASLGLCHRTRRTCHGRWRALAG